MRRILTAQDLVATFARKRKQPTLQAERNRRLFRPTAPLHCAHIVRASRSTQAQFERSKVRRRLEERNGSRPSGFGSFYARV